MLLVYFSGTTAATATQGPGGGTSQTAGGAQQAAQSGKQKMAVEHSATVDKGLKMKIKRTKPGTKTSEAKHEIVKSNEQNGSIETTNTLNSSGPTTTQNVGEKQPQTGGKHSQNQQPASVSNQLQTTHNQNSAKRGSSGHRRDKTKDKQTSGSTTSKPSTPSSNQTAQLPSDTSVNGVVRGVNSSAGPQRPTTPQRTGQPTQQTGGSANAPGPPTIANTAAQQNVNNQQGKGPEVNKVPAVVIMPSPAVAQAQAQAAQNATQQSAAQQQNMDDRCSSPPPAKKLKTTNSEPKVRHYFPSNTFFSRIFSTS